MTEILRRKIIKLVRGEEGVALVVTLALFMFLYVSCAGVYSIGQAIKERIILQNAADAAAYSAAMAEADILSRIATINRTMAWTYKSLVSSQMDWIALRLLSASIYGEEGIIVGYLANQASADAIGAYLTPEGTIGIKAGASTLAPSVEKEVVPRLLSMPVGLAGLHEQILEYSEQLSEMNMAVQYLKGVMNARIKLAAENALQANLPARTGDLCRWNVSEIPVDDILVEMNSIDEERFVKFSWPEESIGDIANQDWFPLQFGQSFTRYFFGVLRTFWEWKPKGLTIIKHESLDAERFKGEFPEAYQPNTASPLIVDESYFPSEQTNEDSGFRVSKGAITVAVAKKCENPWYGITDGRGIYSAFAPSDAASWTVVLSTAQAGYREFRQEVGYDYSLKWDDSQQWNLKTDDWNAMFVPIRKAFKRGVGADSLAKWMKDGTWNRVVSSAKYVKDLEKFEFDEHNDSALPRMHNNGGAESALRWDDDEFLNLMYH